jgi:sigma-B regulation protein RsbU (phosphoserine phosphatase)
MDISSNSLFFILIEKISVIVIIAYLITRTKYFSEVLDGKFTPKNKAGLILIFGAFSIFGTSSGVEILGVVANVRDLGPMIGGLIGGPVIGIGAGLIGGAYRYFLGGFTAVPCSMATIIAGLLGGVVYKLNKGKFIGTYLAVAFAVLMEISHMVLVLLVARPYSDAVCVVQETGLPIIISNSFGMFIFAFMISNLIKERDTAGERDRYFAELERKKYELKIAHDIQRSFLPETVPSLKGFDLAAINHSAKEVGGDFYDFIPISDHQIGLTIGDVSGKSVSAALFMALSRTIVRASAAGKTLVAESMKNANKLIAADAKSGMFVTLFYALLDSKERTLTYVNAGHNPPLILNGKTGDLALLKAKGIVMGAMEDSELEEKEIELNDGDLVVFYTDGVTEAFDKDFNQFGLDRLQYITKKYHNLSAEGLIGKIMEEVLSFSGEAPQSDDITLMVLKVEKIEE